MGEYIMDAGIMSTIILCFVGIIKLPFKKFKENHSTAYKVIFYALSLILAIAIPVVVGLLMLDLSFATVEFYVLIITTIAGVFGLYSSYEGTGLKTLVQTIVSKIKTLCTTYSDSKLTKIIEQVGIDKLLDLANSMTATDEETTETTETAVIEEMATTETTQTQTTTQA